MKDFSLKLFGWYGALAIVGAYGLVSFSILEATSIWYQLLNASGALGIIGISWHKGVHQSVALNLFWLGIAVVAIFNIVRP